eukprot:COSAG05_NODE_278_length_12330_cov_14.132205_9_plen_272_part_00
MYCEHSRVVCLSICLSVCPSICLSAREVLSASGAWRAAEVRYEAAGDAVELAEERVCEARFLLASARSGRHPRQAIAARRLRRVEEEAHRACLVANAARDDADAAADECDACNAGLLAAEDRADNARERLRAAEREAVWSRTVAVLARLRAERRRSHSLLEEEQDEVLVVDEKEVFAVPEDPEGFSALLDDDLPPLLDIFESLSGEGSEEGAASLVYSAMEQEGSSCGVVRLQGSVLWGRHRHNCGGGAGRWKLGGGGDDGGAWRQFDPGG